jgi:hypothetical protein
VCISAEMVGAFLAAILIWLTYIPHFQPLEVVQQNEENLMCNCCDIESAGVAIIKQELSAPAHRYVSAGTRDQETTAISKIQPRGDKEDHELQASAAHSFWQTIRNKALTKILQYLS